MKEISKFNIVVMLGVLTFIFSCNSTNNDVPNSVMAAFIRSNGLIQTSITQDGVNWQHYVHTGSTGVKYGVAVAVNATNRRMYYLTYFYDSPDGSLLVVETGVGNQSWNDAHPEVMSYPSLSAPSMCYIGDNKFLIAWKEPGGIGTVVYDAAAPDIPERRFVNRNDIDDAAALACEGTPSVVCDFRAEGKPTYIIWKDGTTNTLKQRTGILRSDGTVDFSSVSTQNVSLTGTIIGVPDLIFTPYNSGLHFRGSIILKRTVSVGDGGSYNVYDLHHFDRDSENEYHIPSSYGAISTPPPINSAFAYCQNLISKDYVSSLFDLNPIPYQTFPHGEYEDVSAEFFLLPSRNVSQESLLRIHYGVNPLGHYKDFRWSVVFGDEGAIDIRPDLINNSDPVTY